MRKNRRSKLHLDRETVTALTLPKHTVVGAATYTCVCTDDTCATTNGTGCDTRGTCGTQFC